MDMDNRYPGDSGLRHVRGRFSVAVEYFHSHLHLYYNKELLQVEYSWTVIKPLLIAQSFYRPEISGFTRRVKTEEHADRYGDAESEQYRT